MSPPLTWQRIKAAAVGLCGLTLAFAGLAAQQGPRFYVDASNPPAEDDDGDSHFRSISAALASLPRPAENDTVLVAPGHYPEDVVIAVEGLTLEASGPAGQTVIEGAITVRAKRVRISGLTVDASGRSVGVRVEADQAQLRGLEVFGAQTGVLLAGEAPLQDALLVDNHLFHNGVGLRAVDLRRAALRRNRVEANDQDGGRLQAPYSLELADNEWGSNGGVGLLVRGGLHLSLSGERLLGNGGDGLLVEGVSEMVVVGSVFSQNGGAGARWRDAQDNVLQGSTLENNRAAGLVLEARSQRNRIAANSFRGHSAEEAAGVWLKGAVYDNALLDNALEDNWVGLRLSGARRASPGANRFEANRIERSSADGVWVTASEGDNHFTSNRLAGNGRHGFSLAGHNDELQDNGIQRSGAAGVWLKGAQNVLLVDNRVEASQGPGVLVSQSALNNRLRGNVIQHNHREGVRLEASAGGRLERNLLLANALDGVTVSDARRTRLEGNQIRDNGGFGLAVNRAQGVTLRANEISGNHRGGVTVQVAQGVELEGNSIADNLQVGLRAVEAQLSARRNWWGDPLGPAGALAGRGNAVEGLDLAQLTPWLPDRPERLRWAATRAFLLDAVGRGVVVELTSPAPLGLSLELSHLGTDARGDYRPVSLGVVVVARYRGGVVPEAVVPLPGQLALFSLQVEGLTGGQALLSVPLAGLPAGVDPESLRLWRWDGTRWRALPGSAGSTAGRVSGELGVTSLQPGWIALAPLRPVATAPGGPPQDEPPAPGGLARPAGRSDGLRWLAGAWGLLLIGWAVSGAPRRPPNARP